MDQKVRRARDHLVPSGTCEAGQPLSCRTAREWEESNLMDTTEECPSTDLKSAKPTGTQTLPRFHDAELAAAQDARSGRSIVSW